MPRTEEEQVHCIPGLTAEPVYKINQEH